jgi:ABC-type amino acid transport substrate-binding protein
MFMVAYTPERSEYMGFTSPHHTLETRLVAAEDRQMSLDEPGLQVITIRNYEIEDWLDENHPDVVYVSVDSFEEGLALLQQGEADAFADVWRVV